MSKVPVGNGPQECPVVPRGALAGQGQTMPDTLPLLSDDRDVCWGWGSLAVINLADVGREALGKGHSVENILVLGPVCVLCPS